MRRLFPIGAAGVVLAALIALYLLWWAPGPRSGPHTIIVQEGSTVGSVARQLEKQGAIPGSARTFYVMARIFGSHDPIQAGEFAIPKGTGGAAILDLLQHGKPIQRLVTVTEGMPSISSRSACGEPYLTGHRRLSRKARSSPTATATSAARRAPRSSHGCSRR